MKKITKIAAVAAVFPFILAGCSQGGSGSGASEGGDKIKVGMALPAGNETYWTTYLNSAQAEADKLGVDITFTDAKSDANAQNEQVQSLITSGVKGISIASVDPTANKSAAVAATDANIPLITGNRTLDGDYGGPTGANPRLHVGFDDVKIGEEQGELVKQACEKKDPCQVVLETGTLGSTPQVQRQEGLEKSIADSPNIKIIDTQANNFDPTKAVEVTQTLLQAHQDFDVLATQEDPTAVAASRVVKEQNRSEDIKVIGIGGSSDGVKAIESGDMYGTVWVSVKDDGALAVRSLVDVINGKEVDVEQVQGRPTVSVPFAAVTKENAKDHPGEW